MEEQNLSAGYVQTSFDFEQTSREIIDYTRGLVEKYIVSRGHDNPPFLTTEFLELLGVKEVVKDNLGKTSAVLLRFPDGYVIKVNSNHHLYRQNFSCAHEIGHILLDKLKVERYTNLIQHRDFNPQKSSSLRANMKERLCNTVAAELIMPSDIFKEHLLNIGISVNAIERLSMQFLASYHSVAIKIAEVSPQPCAVLNWASSRNNKSRSLKLGRQVNSDSFKKDNNKYTPVHTSVSYPSTLHTAYHTDKIVKSRKLFKSGNTKKSFLLESKGFGSGETRYVISIAFPDE